MHITQSTLSNTHTLCHDLGVDDVANLGITRITHNTHKNAVVKLHKTEVLEGIVGNAACMHVNVVQVCLPANIHVVILVIHKPSTQLHYIYHRAATFAAWSCLYHFSFCP